MIGTKADGVDGYAQLAQLRDGVAVDAAGIVAAVSQQNDGAKGHRAGFSRNVLQAVADARGVVVGLQIARRSTRTASRPNSYNRT